MKEYMVTCDLPESFSPDFIETIPKQRQKINELFKAGKLTSYSLALDRSKLWTVVLGETEEEVMEVLATFPLIDYLRVDIHQLAFNDRARIVLPAMSLN